MLQHHECWNWRNILSKLWNIFIWKVSLICEFVSIFSLTVTVSFGSWPRKSWYISLWASWDLSKREFSLEKRSRVMSRFNFGKKAIVLISLGAIFFKGCCLHLELFCRSIKMAKTELSHVNKHVFQKLNMYFDIHIFDTNRKWNKLLKHSSNNFRFLLSAKKSQVDCWYFVVNLCICSPRKCIIYFNKHQHC